MNTIKPIINILIFLMVTSSIAQQHVLVFTKTAGYRHASIETGVKTIQELGEQDQYTVTHTEDAEHFSTEILATYDLVLFLSTTGDILNTKQQKAFETYIQNGGSFMGIHAAADTEYDWLWYGKLVGGYFLSHPNNPNIRNARLLKTSNNHPSTLHYPETFKRDDEWYNYKNINPEITPVLVLDETSYDGGENGTFHPIAWYHEYDGGKVFYTGGGHTKASYNEPDFRKHLQKAILWCLEE